MNILQALGSLLGGGHPAAQQTQGRALPAPHPLAQQLQHMQYAQPLPPPPVNGQVDPHMMALYQQALHAHQQLQVQSQHSPGNLGVPYGMNHFGSLLNQGNQYNPGYTPLQNSGFGPGGNPQMGAYQDQPGQLNPQPLQYRIQPGQEWLQ